MKVSENKSIKILYFILQYQKMENVKFSYSTVWVQQYWALKAVIPTKPVSAIEWFVQKNVGVAKNNSLQNIRNNASQVVEWNTEVTASYQTELNPIESVWWLYGLLWKITSTDVSSWTDWSVYKHEIEDDMCTLPHLAIESKRWWCVAWSADADWQSTLVSRGIWMLIDSGQIVVEQWVLKLNFEAMWHWAFDTAKLITDFTSNASTTNISAISLSWNVATITSTSHWLSAGDLVEIDSVTPSDYDGWFKVDSVVDSDNFKITYNDASWFSAYSSWGTVQKLAVWVFEKWSVYGLAVWDSVKLYETSWETSEDLTVGAVDPANDKVGFATDPDSEMTVAKNCKMDLSQQSITYSEPILFGIKNVKLQVSDTLANAANADARSVDGLTVWFANNIEQKFQTQYNQLRDTGLDWTVDITAIFEDKTQMDRHRNRDELAMIITIDSWQVISATDTNNETYKLVIKMPRVVFETHETTWANNSVIEENLVWLALHDTWESKTGWIEVYNWKAWTYYA